MTLLKRFYKSVLDFIYPHLCIKCWTVVEDDAGFCSACFKKIRFVTQPFCDMCALPLEVSATEETRCAPCLQEEKLFKKARTVLVYDDESKPFILSFKNKGRTMYRKPLSHLMIQRGQDLFEDADIVTTVPMHFLKRFLRGYNQADLLGETIAAHYKKAFMPELLKKIKMTKSQAGLHQEERLKNVKSSFALNPKHAPLIKGKIIVLVDDVMTSGATVTAVTKVILKGDPKEVRVLTLARTVRR